MPLGTIRYRPTEGAGRRAAIGILLANLGTPDAPTVTAVRRYLAEFLADPRVIEAPRWLWRVVLHGVILRIRPRRSARAYAKVWTPAGSPLLTHSAALLEALRERLAGAGWRGPLEMRLGMRYGNPSIGAALDELRAAGVDRLLVLPLYPQYSGPSGGAVFDAVAADLARWRRVPETRFVADYHDHPLYVEALCRCIESGWASRGRADRLLLSFHGLPERYVRAGDPYREQCERTAGLVAGRLGLARDAWALSFQSRVGREPWLRPYTDELLREWAGAGVGSVEVICPGFAADCLETLEEIAMEAKDEFESAGGGSLSYIPALNARPDHVEALAAVLLDRSRDWREIPD